MFVFKWAEYITDYYCTQLPMQTTQVLFVLSKSVMFQFCFSFVILYLSVMPPLLEVMQLVPKSGHCTISTDCYLTSIISVRHPLPCNASACYPSHLVHYVQHLSFPYILSDSLFNTPPEMRKLYHLHIQFTPIIVKKYCWMWQCPFYTLQIANKSVAINL